MCTNEYYSFESYDLFSSRSGPKQKSYIVLLYEVVRETKGYKIHL